jgi:DNA polymerase sigma
MTTIKYWAMHHKLSGSGDRNVMINNYAICLLVIFYLQSENILPSVKKLQQNMDASESVSIKIKGKKVAYGFPNDLSKWRGKEVDLSENAKSLTELLYGFFDFYANFDYLNSIISPNTGQIISRLVLSCQITIFYSNSTYTRSLLDKLFTTFQLSLA